MTSLFQIAPSPSRQAIRLFCVPHAGVGPSAFRGWKEQLRPDVEVIVIQLPGREGRFREEPYQRIEGLASDLTEAMLPYLADDQRFAFFGNSLGGLISFQTLHEIQRRTGRRAAHFFVSAIGAPHIPPPLPPMGNLGDQELVREISERYGGIPSQVMQDEEFLAAVVPTLRADIRMLEAYDRGAPHPLSCPITAFGGIRDQTVPMEHIAGWREQTTGSFSRVILDEEHLFLQSAREELIANVRQTLLDIDHEG